MKIAFYETKEAEQKYLAEKLAGIDATFSTERLSEENLPAPETEGLVVFVGSPVTENILAKLPNLKFIATQSTGFDHIDIKACAKRNIPVSYVPSYGENTVAEFAFALLLALTRKLYPSIKRVREDGLFSYEGLCGIDLAGRTIGVVGTGRIGQHVLRMANGFNMKIVAHDPFPKPELAKQYNFTYLPLADLLKQSDFVTLHVPYMPATHHLINRENIKLMKPGSILINTARGGLVETAALVASLKSGQLAGAGLDVLEEEGFIKDEDHYLAEGHPNEQQLKTALADHELMHMDNVIITPHNAFNTEEALKRILDTTIGNIQAFAQGKPGNLVKAD